MIIAAKPQEIHTSQKDLFEFLSDFNNYEHLMPEQIVNWTSDNDSCSFTISGMLSLTLKFKEKTPYRQIDIVPDGKSPIRFVLKIMLEEHASAQQQTTAKVEVDADLNPMMAM
ncbi:MAG: SRPBCC family protein, partial [Bacteroidetes bacterium]